MDRERLACVTSLLEVEISASDASRKVEWHPSLLSPSFCFITPGAAPSGFRKLAIFCQIPASVEHRYLFLLVLSGIRGIFDQEGRSDQFLRTPPTLGAESTCSHWCWSHLRCLPSDQIFDLPSRSASALVVRRSPGRRAITAPGDPTGQKPAQPSPRAPLSRKKGASASPNQVLRMVPPPPSFSSSRFRSSSAISSTSPALPI